MGCKHCEALGFTYSEQHKKECFDRYVEAQAQTIAAMPFRNDRAKAIADMRETAKRIADLVAARVTELFAKRKPNA
jgi:hypothetical protein